MKQLFVFFLVLQSSMLFAQPLKGIWHGKLNDNNGNVIKYVNISIEGEAKNLKGIIREYDKKENKWMPINGINTEFITSYKNGILSTINEQNVKTESSVFLFSYINNKRIAVEWVNQINYSDSSKNIITKQGTGFLEPFLNGDIYESLSIGGTSTNRVSIDKVEIAKELTVITFSYHNTSFETVMMNLSVPGTLGAYYITPPDRSQKYNIVDKDNIAYSPENTLVAPNSFHTFKVYFEPIPDSLSSFSILEGAPELQSGKEWNFYDIQLK